MGINMGGGHWLALCCSLYLRPIDEAPGTTATMILAHSEPGARRSRAIYVAIGLSGASALAAEVIWTRLLSLLLGGTVYTFSIILAVFFIGLGVGSSIG